eukprot:2140640-Amphidinium_carterae.1
MDFFTYFLTYLKVFGDFVEPWGSGFHNINGSLIGGMGALAERRDQSANFHDEARHMPCGNSRRFVIKPCKLKALKPQTLLSPKT